MADALPTYPASRPAAYDADLVWDEDLQQWVSTETLLARNGSRYHTQFFAVAGDRIYYEEVS
jgi:hypothetical protein